MRCLFALLIACHPPPPPSIEVHWESAPPPPRPVVAEQPVAPRGPTASKPNPFERPSKPSPSKPDPVADSRDDGGGITREPEQWEICYQETQSVTRGGCIAHCDREHHATCIATCTTMCPIDPPDSGDD